MEALALTPEQFQALEAGNITAIDENGQLLYAYAQDETDDSNGTPLIHAPEIDEPAASATPPEQQILVKVQESQEVIIYDEDTGQYQQCYYVPTDDSEPSEPHPEESSTTENTAIQVDPAPEAQASETNLQTLYENGTISLKTYLSLLGVSKEQAQQVEEELLDSQNQDQPVQITADPSSQVIQASQNVAKVVEHEVQAPEFDATEFTHFLATPSQPVQNPVQEDESSMIQYYAANVNKPLLHRINPSKPRTTITSDKITWEQQVCTICHKVMTKKGFGRHFKDAHADIRLGCPKCSQTYHSPELLNVHYRHYHPTEVEDYEHGQSDADRSVLKNVRLLMKCKSCDILVKDLYAHMMAFHSAQTISASSKDLKFSTYDCETCQKSFGTRREYANHHRRKGFCRPPVVKPFAQTRRVGILRKIM